MPPNVGNRDIDPTRRIIVVSYSNEFAAELHRQFRMITARWHG
jgi:hypothetical protein